MERDLNEQQESLIELLQTAIADLKAGRPAQRTAYALSGALSATSYDDLDRGLADDQAWRERRGIT